MVDDRVTVELSARDVDRYIECVAAGMPRSHLLAGLVQHPAANLADLPGPLEDRDEAVGPHEPQGRMLPPQQGLDPHDLEVLEVVDRLIQKPQLLALERGAQVELELEALRAV